MTERSPISLALAVGYGHSTNDELDALTRALRSEIAELGVDDVVLPTAGPAANGAKSADPVTLGALAVVVLPVVVPKLIDFLTHWKQRDGDRKIKVTLSAGDKRVEIELPADARAASAVNDLLESAKKATE